MNYCTCIVQLMCLLIIAVDVASVVIVTYTITADILTYTVKTGCYSNTQIRHFGTQSVNS